MLPMLGLFQSTYLCQTTAMPGREEERASVIGDWLHDVRESGIWLPFAVVLVLGLVLAGLDVWRWDRDFANAMLAEMNAVVIELFIVGVVLVAWEYRRRRKGEIRDLSKELFNLRLAGERAAIDRKEEILQALAARGRKPETLQYADLRGVREMTCEQLASAQNWQSAYRDPELACGAPVPTSTNAPSACSSASASASRATRPTPTSSTPSTTRTGARKPSSPKTTRSEAALGRRAAPLLRPTSLDDAECGRRR
jgi:hypothetical protein